jgi:hypothetical protein
LLKQATEKRALLDEVDVLVDRQKVSAYKIHDYESEGALEKIVIRRADGSDRHDDVANVSDVVKAIGERELFRVYARDKTSMDRLKNIWHEVSQ